MLTVFYRCASSTTFTNESMTVDGRVSRSNAIMLQLVMPTAGEAVDRIVLASGKINPYVAHSSDGRSVSKGHLGALSLFQTKRTCMRRKAMKAVRTCSKAWVFLHQPWYSLFPLQDGYREHP